MNLSPTLGFSLLFACLRLHRRQGEGAWWLYKLVTFPYLGIMFLVMMLEVRPI